MHQCRRRHQPTRPAFWSGTCSGPDMSLHVMTRSAGLLNSPGLQALSMHQSMHQCRRRYQSTRPVPLHGPHQSTRPALRSGTCSGPDMSLHVPFCLESTSPALRSGTCSGPDMSLRVMTRSAGLLNSPGLQALSMHQCRRPYQSTRPALRSGTCSRPTSPYPLVPTSTRPTKVLPHSEYVLHMKNLICFL